MQSNKENYLFWSPSVTWSITNNGQLKIQNYVFNGFGAELFPKFYFKTCEGIKDFELISYFADYDKKKISNFIKQLTERKILIEDIQEVDELFFPQNKLFQAFNPYKKEVFLDANELKKFVEASLTREKKYEGLETIQMTPSSCIPDFFENRKSIRKFDNNRKIDFKTFSDVLNILSQIASESKRRYYYASAGGLYPIDCYIYVKENRIEGIAKGIYIYAPIEKALKLINSEPDIMKEAHYFMNQTIFESSAFSIYFVYDAMHSMPKYTSLGYYYAIIDMGIMIEALTIQAEMNGIGSCSIGDMNFRKICTNFNLAANQKYLHCMEFGLKEEASE